MNIKRRYFALAGALAIAGGLAFAVAPVASATPSCAPTGVSASSYVSPIHGGQALNAINWGGSGHKSTACTGALVNDNIKTWRYPAASVASDFTPVAVTGLAGSNLTKCTATGAGFYPGCVLLEYTPFGQHTGLCISTVLDLKGAFSRLRNCASSLQDNTAGHVVNQWQDFALVPEGDGFWQIEAVLEPTPFSLNIAGFGGNGTQVISWTPLVMDACSDNTPATPCAENEIFEVLPAA